MDAELRAAIEQELGPVQSARPVSGGDINQALQLSLVGGSSVFIKTNPRAPSDLFEREAEGLAWLSEVNALRVPRVIAFRTTAPCYLALEYLPSAPRAKDFDAVLGVGLAQLHAAPAPSWGGLGDNYIGLLPQSNASAASWGEFYVQRRLDPQLRRARDQRRCPSSWTLRFESLFRRLPELLVDEPPQRVHGDLWAGNVHTGPSGEPCLIDPAAYAGHREVDLAMLQLFGGFSERTFAAYDECFPTLPGRRERVPLYQLYPLLVHVNLFGGSYGASVEGALSRLGV